MHSMRRRSPLLAVALVAPALLSAPAAAHGTDAVAVGLAFPAVVVASVGASLLGGGVVHAATTTLPVERAVPPLLTALGTLSVGVALDGAAVGAGLGVTAGVAAVVLGRGRGLVGCGDCADAALGAVTLHRGLEGVALSTLYAADAALGTAGAAVLSVHAAVETAAVGSLHATTGRGVVPAVALLQVGFVVGVGAGWSVVGAIPAVVESGLLALVGGVLVAVGAGEAYRRHAAASVATPT